METLAKFLSWVKEIDVVKAIFLAIVAVISSWYDLKSEVKSNKMEFEQKWQVQLIKDKYQDDQIRNLHDDVKDGFKELKQLYSTGRGR